MCNIFVKKLEDASSAGPIYGMRGPELQHRKRQGKGGRDET